MCKNIHLGLPAMKISSSTGARRAPRLLVQHSLHAAPFADLKKNNNATAKEDNDMALALAFFFLVATASNQRYTYSCQSHVVQQSAITRKCDHPPSSHTPNT